MLVIDPERQRLPQGRRAANGRPYSLPLAPSARGLRPQAVGRELYGCPKYFGLWQSSLPPPLRGTSLAEGGFISSKVM